MVFCAINQKNIPVLSLKISAVRQYIADMLDNSDKKFLVFAHHLDVMKAIELEVMKKKVKYIRIAGDVPSVLRGVSA